MKQPSTIGKLKHLLINIISSNLPPDTDLEVLRKIYLLNLITILGSIFLTIFGLLAFVKKAYLLGTVDFLVFFILLCLVFYLRRTNNYSFAGIIGTAATGVFYFFLVANGGINGSAYVWVFTYPLIAVFLLGSKLGCLASFVLLGSMQIVFVFGVRVASFTSYNSDLVLRISMSYITVTLFTLVMERVRLATQNRLRISNTKLEEAVKGLEKAHTEKDGLIIELQQKIDEVKTLQGIIPICVSCKKIRDDDGYWRQVEEYVRSHSHAEFSHGICPDCAKKLYPGLKMDDSK